MATPDTQWGKYAGLGLEVAVGVGLGYAVGRWLDTHWGWHRAPLVGMLLGIAGGMYLLIKQAIEMNRDA
jgi:hypothetical protein